MAPALLLEKLAAARQVVPVQHLERAMIEAGLRSTEVEQGHRMVVGVGVSQPAVHECGHGVVLAAGEVAV
ncbi:hypothetical protein D3C80_1928110 [compost metagenome]